MLHNLYHARNLTPLLPTVATLFPSQAKILNVPVTVLDSPVVAPPIGAPELFIPVTRPTREAVP